MPQKIGLTIVVFIWATAALAQERGPAFQLTKITRNLISTPEFNYSGAETFRVNTRDRWLAVEVEFTAVAEFTEAATFKYFILINGKLLTGEVTHVNILGGRDRRSVMYVPPKALAHVIKNRPLTASAVENVAVQVLVDGNVQSELSAARSRSQWYAALSPVAGLVLNKNQTPFAPLYWDHYEQIKPADG
ncbi:MAG: Amuc_1102 family pilus-like protein [Chthoniobacterales bacterium]